jgi:hypothetical protein
LAITGPRWPLSLRRFWLAGQKSSNGSVSLGIENQGRTSIDTLKASGICHCEAGFEKVMSGGVVKASPAVFGEKPERAENLRGDRIVGRANPSVCGHGLLPGSKP